MAERPSLQTEPNKREVSLYSYFSTLGNRIELRRISHGLGRPFHPAPLDDVYYLKWHDNKGEWRKMHDGNSKPIADVGLYGDPGVPGTPYFYEPETFDETPWLFTSSIKKILWNTFLLTKAELSDPLQHSPEQLIEFARAKIREEVLIERLKEKFPNTKPITGWEKPIPQAT